MKIQHHIGGIEGLGSVDFQKRVFVVPWEERIFGIHVAMMGLSSHLKESVPKYAIEKVPTAFKSFWTWGHLRTGAEGLNPFDYFRFRYYEKWLGGISGFFIQEGYISEEELDARTAVFLEDGNMDDAPLPEGGDPAIDDQVIKYLQEGDTPRRERQAPPKFAVGDKVVVKDVPAKEHTRLPGHLRGRTGSITHVYEDSYAYFFPTGDGIGEPMPTYIVQFSPADIWGESLSDPNSTFYADLFETYVVPA